MKIINQAQIIMLMLRYSPYSESDAGQSVLVPCHQSMEKRNNRNFKSLDWILLLLLKHRFYLCHTYWIGQSEAQEASKQKYYLQHGVTVHTC